MTKIKLKTGISEQDAVFEKTGIKMEFKIEDIENYLNDLHKQKGDIEQQLVQIALSMDKLENVDEITVAKKQYNDFKEYLLAKARIQAAEEVMKDLDEEHTNFASSEVENLEETVKHLHYILTKESLDSQLELVDKTITDYQKDLEKAQSCLETTQK